MSAHDLTDDNVAADLMLIASVADPELLDAVQQHDADLTTTDADNKLHPQFFCPLHIAGNAIFGTVTGHDLGLPADAAGA